MVRIVLSRENPNRLEDIDRHFAEGGEWERKEGREMTTSFAEAFVQHVRIPLEGPFSLLDMGCALGGSMPVFHAAYPQARLSGCDISANAIRRCTKEHGHFADFFVSPIDELDRSFDVIFCSNIIEHIENHVDIVRQLASRAKIVYIMVPYLETVNGQRLHPALGMWHVATFDEHTFDPLKADGFEIRTEIFRAPPYWGYAKGIIPLAKLKALVLGRPFVDKRQIVYELRRR